MEELDEQWNERMEEIEKPEKEKMRVVTISNSTPKGTQDLADARVIFDKVVQVNYKTVDNLASVCCEWAEMELKHKNFKGALELMRQATVEPSVEVKRKGTLSYPCAAKLNKKKRTG
ncbi:hypothetical protein LR48_Vigan07g159900 [Vigna angularis]|uniref:Pre-mRNA-splicing factor Syf1/CRNKL1-like C-terminal HAT-repeats domain-containing protein n=2 Tax=Phaseolus angularis TaxID=3914 RepID=A0A0L9UYF9_PHAAN|nr:hypothetical protein LR48_Vigan07g159900 [Vigna angularis]BAT97797.1 hypothetical protein VIGAN_09135100 [Vigna angularis var. angularis]